MGWSALGTLGRIVNPLQAPGAGARPAAGAPVAGLPIQPLHVERAHAHAHPLRGSARSRTGTLFVIDVPHRRDAGD